MIRAFIRFLASLRITVAGLFLLLVLTVWGTLYQVDHGLYGAQERFYQSWWLFIAGVVPFPGAQTVMLVLFVNLIASLVVVAARGRLRWGFIATHAGLLMMLSAGAVTFYLGQESQLSLEEGESSNSSIDYNDWELSLLPASGTRVQALDRRFLKPGRKIELPEGLGVMTIERSLRNCEPTREPAADAPHNRDGISGLQPRAPAKEPSDNRPGLIFSLEQDGKSAGRFLLWAGDSGSTMIPAPGGGARRITFRQQRLPLPATIELVDFRREMHPGSSIAKSYSSQVIVRNGSEGERKVVISMNKPLRLRGFTFYQSSFSSSPMGREVSTFSVVRNYGRLMPYIATGLTAAGMMLHFAGVLIIRLRQPKMGKAAA